MASSDDFEAQTNHRATYSSFTGFVKWGTIAIVLAVLMLYIFLV